jgi:hypothetical protein
MERCKPRLASRAAYSLEAYWMDAAIGVVDEAGRRIARFDRLVERVHGQPRLERHPSDDPRVKAP